VTYRQSAGLAPCKPRWLIDPHDPQFGCLDFLDARDTSHQRQATAGGHSANSSADQIEENDAKFSSAAVDGDVTSRRFKAFNSG
jgi:hypothetical protein